MKKYVYENATVYITVPTEKQIENIRKATERFVRRLAKEGMIDDVFKRQSDRGTSIGCSNARERDPKIKG